MAGMIPTGRTRFGVRGLRPDLQMLAAVPRDLVDFAEYHEFHQFFPIGGELCFLFGGWAPKQWSPYAPVG